MCVGGWTLTTKLLGSALRAWSVAAPDVNEYRVYIAGWLFRILQPESPNFLLGFGFSLAPMPPSIDGGCARRLRNIMT